MYALIRLRTAALDALAAATLIVLIPGCGDSSGDDKPGSQALVVYSARAEQLIKPLFDRYTEETGKTIVYTTDSEQPLIQRLKSEGASTKADLLLTVDAGNLWFAAKEGVLRRVESGLLDAAVPSHLRDPENRWFGLSVRARTIAYDVDAVDPGELSGYSSLADPKWRGRLCLRSSKKVYNQSLVAMLIAQHGEEEAEEIVRGWVENLATNVFSNDTKLLEAMIAGQCEIGIVNSYYFGRLERDGKVAGSVRLFWPDASTGGVHVNVAGAGVTAHAKQPEAAQALLEWLAEGEAQQLFAALNLEYPVNPAVEPDPLVAAWGEYDASSLPVAEAGRLQADAVRLMDRAGYR